MILHQLAAGDLDALQKDRVLPRIQLQVVGDVHRRHNQAHFQCDLAANRFDPVQEIAALACIHIADQAVAHLDPEQIDLQKPFDLLLGLFRFRFSALVPSQ